MKKHTIDRFLPYILLVGGAVGLLASFILAVEKFALLKDPGFVSTCNINPILSCVSVASTSQASVFGFPNMFLGILGFSMVMVVGAGMLAGARFKPWFWQLFSLGTLGGIVFVHWLFVQSVYVIGALCIYCMLVWAVTAPIFWYTFIYNVQSGNLPFLKRFKRLAGFLESYHGVILASWYVLIVFLIVQHFWGAF